jgi:hypothetical protein
MSSLHYLMTELKRENLWQNHAVRATYSVHYISAYSVVLDKWCIPALTTVPSVLV